MTLEKGSWGQFDVLVDGQVVVSRKGGLIAKLVGRPWPEHGEVVDAVRAAVEQNQTELRSSHGR